MDKMAQDYHRRLNKGFRSKFHEGYPDWQTLDEGRRPRRPKHCDDDIKDQNKDPNITGVNKDNSSPLEIQTEIS